MQWHAEVQSRKLKQSLGAANMIRSILQAQSTLVSV
jgi:hypothetical protein